LGALERCELLLRGPPRGVPVAAVLFAHRAALHVFRERGGVREGVGGGEVDGRGDGVLRPVARLSAVDRHRGRTGPALHARIPSTWRSSAPRTASRVAGSSTGWLR